MIQSTTLKKIVSTISILMINCFGSIALSNSVIENFEHIESFHENYLIRESFHKDSIIVNYSLVEGCINCMLDLETCEQKLDKCVETYNVELNSAQETLLTLRNQLLAEQNKLRPLRKTLWVGLPITFGVGVLTGILIKK